MLSQAEVPIALKLMVQGTQKVIQTCLVGLQLVEYRYGLFELSLHEEDGCLIEQPKILKQAGIHVEVVGPRESVVGLVVVTMLHLELHQFIQSSRDSLATVVVLEGLLEGKCGLHKKPFLFLNNSFECKSFTVVRL